jgi:hypothetical protein
MERGTIGTWAGSATAGYAAPVTTSLRSRQFPILFIVLASIAFWALVFFAGVRGALLTDPVDILTEGLTATTEADSFHLEATFGGSVTEPETGMDVPLDGVTLGGDVDIAGEAAHLTFAFPAMLGLSGEVIAIGSDSWVKTSMTGEDWIHSVTPEGEEPMGEPPTADEIAAKIEELAALDGVVLEKLADEPCGEDACYHVRLTVPAEVLAEHEGMGDGALGPMMPPGAFGGPLVIDLLFEQDDLWLREASTGIAAEDMGDVTFAVAFSAFNESVDISAPPPDQVIEEGDVPIPVPY